jgi:hypothetical protein
LHLSSSPQSNSTSHHFLYPNRDLLSEAMERVGKEGVITVQDGKTLHNELEVVEGMKFDRGYISPYFITDNKAQIVEFEKPLILLVEKRISSLASLIPLLENVVKNQRSLLIVAEVSTYIYRVYSPSLVPNNFAFCTYFLREVHHVLNIIHDCNCYVRSHEIEILCLVY